MKSLTVPPACTSFHYYMTRSYHTAFRGVKSCINYQAIISTAHVEHLPVKFASGVESIFEPRTDQTESASLYSTVMTVLTY